MTAIHIPTSSHTDGIARVLIRTAAFARLMPPAWQGARCSVPMCGPDGQYVGKLLPGRGFYLDMDLDRLGITRGRLPHVYQRSLTQRLLDALGDERGAISTYDGIIAARGGGKAFDVCVAKTTLTTVANEWTNLFRAGGFPTAGAFSALGAGTAPSRATAGAWSQGLINPTSPDKKYLLTVGFGSTSAINELLLADLLVEDGGILVNAANAVNSAALTRYTTGAGVLANFTVTTALGATGGTIQLASYTNQGGTAAQANSAATCVDACIADRLVGGIGGSTTLGGVPWTNLAAGDYGVRAVATATSAGATAGASAFGLSLYYPLAYVPGVAANFYAERDSTIQIDGLVELTQAAGVLGCLVGFVQTNGVTSGAINVFMRTCDG